MYQMTEEEKHIYRQQLKRLGMIIQKRIEGELQKSSFLDIYSTLGESERLKQLNTLNQQLGDRLINFTNSSELEDIIKTLRRVEFKLQRDRFEEESLDIFAEDKKTDFYEIELAKHLALVNKGFPEHTFPHLRPSETRQLPDVAGPFGGRRKKIKRTKKTKKNIKRSNKGTSKNK